MLDNALAVHVARLRCRLEGTARIRRVRGRGYALALD
ncbi:winged helix-turn-helix domain-containing protein [Nocardioides bigeumensis]